jgi:endonuclease/exonuclease/phosphatase family metal-dependent hydrolase
MDFKLMVWNMEWLNDLFISGSGTAPVAFRPDDEKPAHAEQTAVTVRKRRDDLAAVIKEIAPDLIIVVEGPSRPEELALFFQSDVGPAWRTFLQPTPRSSQNIGAALNAAGGKFDLSATRLLDSATNRAFEPFLVDTDDDTVKEQYHYERLPLDLEVALANGRRLRILGLHLKSKGIFDAYEWSKWWSVADGNRRKILAQALHIRTKFVEPFLTDPATKDIPLIVCGDINDGPGFDASEKRLFGSGIERLMGDVWRPAFCLRNALFDSLPEVNRRKLDFESLYTTRFADPIFNGVYHREWIDHVLYTANQDGAWISAAGVVRKAADDQALLAKYRFASDHYPVIVTVTLP